MKLGPNHPARIVAALGSTPPAAAFHMAAPRTSRLPFMGQVNRPTQPPLASLPGSAGPRRTHSFCTVAAAQAEGAAARARFEAGFRRLQDHEAFAHPVFGALRGRAQAGTLSARQFAVFRDYMLARIFLTMPSIAEHARQALLKGDYLMFATCLRNLNEAGADGDVTRMHPLLAEQAFDAVASALFGLPPSNMRAAFDNLSATSAAMQRCRRCVDELYSTRPAFVSLTQESASGGNGTTGMIPELYALFSSLRGGMPPAVFTNRVQPYFAAHLALDNEGAFLPDAADGIESQHARRALEDALRSIRNVAEADQCLAAMQRFADAQKALFDEMLAALGAG